MSTSRAVTISAISTRGGASRMSMPDGSRQSTSREVRLGDAVGRQVEDRRRVDRHLQERPQVAELEAAVDQDGPLLGLADRHREVEGDRRLADAALRREDANTRATSRSS